MTDNNEATVWNCGLGGGNTDPQNGEQGMHPVQKSFLHGLAIGWGTAALGIAGARRLRDGGDQK